MEFLFCFQLASFIAFSTLVVICQSVAIGKDGGPVTSTTGNGQQSHHEIEKQILGEEKQMDAGFVKAAEPLIEFLREYSRSIISGNVPNLSTNNTLPMHSAVLKALQPAIKLFVQEIPSLVLEETQDKKNVQKFNFCDLCVDALGCEICFFFFFCPPC